MFEIVAGRLCFDGQPLTDELPPAFRMRVEEYLARRLHEALAEQVEDLQKYEVVEDPNGNLRSQPEYELRLPVPENWKEDTMVSLHDVLELLT